VLGTRNRREDSAIELPGHLPVSSSRSLVRDPIGPVMDKVGGDDALTAVLQSCSSRDSEQGRSRMKGVINGCVCTDQRVKDVVGTQQYCTHNTFPDLVVRTESVAFASFPSQGHHLITVDHSMGKCHPTVPTNQRGSVRRERLVSSRPSCERDQTVARNGLQTPGRSGDGAKFPAPNFPISSATVPAVYVVSRTDPTRGSEGGKKKRFCLSTL
jgi:hypothetical protein